MVVHLLPLWGARSEKGPAGVYKVFALVICIAVNDEVFLLKTGGGGNALTFCAEKLQNALCLEVERLHRAQEGRFGVKRFSAVRAESGGDT